MQVLNEQLPEKAKGRAGHVDWVSLTMLHCNKEEALAEAAQVQNLQSQEEALEAQVHQLKEDLHGRGSEAEDAPESPMEKAGKVDIVPHPHVRPGCSRRENMNNLWVLGALLLATQW